MPGVVHKPDSHRHAQSLAKIKNPPFRVQAAQVDGEQQHGIAPGQQIFPGRQQAFRIAALRHSFQHRSETGFVQGLTQFLMQQLPLRAGQQNRAAVVLLRHMFRSIFNDCPPRPYSQPGRAQTSQERTPEIRDQAQTGPIKKDRTARGQGHGIFRRDLLPMPGQGAPPRSRTRALQTAQGFRLVQPEHARAVHFPLRKRQFLRHPRPQPQQQHILADAQSFPCLGIVGQAQAAPREIRQTDAPWRAHGFRHAPSQENGFPTIAAMRRPPQGRAT